MAAVVSRGGDGVVERIPVCRERPLADQGPSPAHRHHCTAAKVTSPLLGESGVVGHSSNTNGIDSPTRTTASYVSAQVCVESPTRHQLQHPPQEGKHMLAKGRSMTASFVNRAASIDTSDQNIPPTAAQSSKQTQSHMRSTQSSLRGASEDNKNNSLASAHHIRICDNSPNSAMSEDVDDDDDGGGNVSSSPSSHRSLQRAHVRSRTVKHAPVIKNVVQRGVSSPTVTKATSDSLVPPHTLKAHGSITVASPASLASRRDVNHTATSDIGRSRSSDAAPPFTSTQCNGAVHKNAVVSQTGSLSSGVGGHRGLSPDHGGIGGISGRGTSGDGDVADSTSLISSQSLSMTIVTLSDDNIAELLGGLSVSQDLGTSGSHAPTKSMQAEQRWWNYSKSRSSAAFTSKGGCNGRRAFSVASDVRRQVERAPCGTQPRSSPIQGSPSSPNVTSNVMTRGHGGLPQKTHCGDASPNAAQGRQRSSDTASNSPLLSTQVPRRTGAQVGGRALQPEKGRRPPLETALQAQSVQIVDEGTKTPAVGCARSFDSKCSTGSQSRGAKTIENTSKGAVKERADGDLNRKAASSAMQPPVPRLALERIHAHRERRPGTAGASYKVARHVVAVSRQDSTTSTSSSSATLDVTVSSLTDSAWPSSHSGGAGHSCTSKEFPSVEELGIIHHQDTLDSAVVADHQHASLSATAQSRHSTIAPGVSTHPSHTNTLVSGSASGKKEGDMYSSHQTSTGVQDLKATCLQVPSSHTGSSKDSPTVASSSKTIQRIDGENEDAMRVKGMTDGNQGVCDIDIALAHSQQAPEAAGLRRRPADTRHNAKCCLVM